MSFAEQPLRLHRLLVEHSLGLMCIHNLDGVLLAINPAVAESLGYEINEGVGRNLKDFLAPSVRPLFDRYIERIRTNGKDSGLMRLVSKDGGERVWMYRNVLHEDESGQQVLGHALDVTDRVAIERELRQAQRDLTRARDELTVRVGERTAELQRANDELKREIVQREKAEEELVRARKLESLGILAGGIAHDFNNFLAIVQGNAELAQTCTSPGEPVHGMLVEISRACERAARLSLQLLTFGKGGAPVRKPTRLGPLLNEAMDVALAGSSVRGECELPRDLWVADVDPGQIAQVLRNLLLNARQAMNERGVVRAQAENVPVGNNQQTTPAGRYIRVRLQDEGCGIAPEDLPRVFDPYFTTKQTGSGLGLATAHSIVSKHGGRISVQSEVGKGTTFVIDLPAATEPVEEQAVKRPARETPSGRILVMDDEEPIRKVLVNILERLGYQVKVASDGAEAVMRYKAALEKGRPFSVVLLDMTIPGGVGGKEAAAQLRKIDPAVKIVVSSGYTDDSVMADYRAHGFDAVLPKPWTAAQVADVMAKVLRR